jgi:hypothetical protein
VTIFDLDIYRAAHPIMKQYGDGAATHARSRIGDLDQH